MSSQESRLGPARKKTLEQTTRTATKIGNRDFTWTGNPGKAKGIYGMKRMENFSYLVKLGLVLAVFQHSGVEGKPWRGKKRENSWMKGVGEPGILGSACWEWMENST